MKRGLIFPRSSMQNPYTAQGLPVIYKTLSNRLVYLEDFSERTGGKLYHKYSPVTYVTTVEPGDTSGSNDSAQQMWDNDNPGGIDFDGTNDYCVLNAVSNSNPLRAYVDYNKQWTLEGWFRKNWSTAGAFYANIFSPAVNNYYGIRIATDTGRNTVEIVVYAATTYAWAIGINDMSNRINNDVYFHWVLSKSGSTLTSADCALYLNGNLMTGGDITTAGTPFAVSIWAASGYPADYNMYFGKFYYGRTGGSVAILDGGIKKAAIYNNTLSATEISTLYNYEKRFVR